MPIKRTPVVLTVENAKALIVRNRKDGLRCPCCTTFCKVYGRSLHHNMAYFLWWLVKAWEKKPRWYHIREAPDIEGRPAGGDYAKLQWWKMIESRANVDPSKKGSGLWRPTQVGIDFVYQRIRVPAKVYLYKKSFMGWGDKWTDMPGALGKHYDYAELMGRTV